MRDLQRLEELSSAAALGLWADDVVLALDRATATGGVQDADMALLTDAADMLEAAKERAEQPFSAPSSARALAATDTALSVVATLPQAQAASDPDRAEKMRDVLGTMVSVLRDASSGSLSDADNGKLELVVTFFGMVGEAQLVESNSVLASRKDAGAWTATRTTSSFS